MRNTGSICLGLICCRWNANTSGAWTNDAKPLLNRVGQRLVPLHRCGQAEMFVIAFSGDRGLPCGMHVVVV